jgi:hypothetical protein
MTEKDTSDAMVDEALGEHRECMQVVSEVEACLECHLDRGGQWVGEVLDVLPRLAASLREHFEAEQEGALFRKVPLTHPQYADRLQRLEAEHDQILKRIDKVIGKAEGVDREKMYEVRELNAQVQMVVATIRRHEAEETEILMGAHWEEIGTGD